MGIQICKKIIGKIFTSSAPSAEKVGAKVATSSSESSKSIFRGVFSSKVKPVTVQDCNLVFHPESSVVDTAEYYTKDFAKRRYKIATSGYSFDVDGYEKITQDFLKELDKCLGKRKTGYIAPPALDKGNIYDMTTRVSGIDSDKIIYLTADRYLKYLNPQNFAKDVNLKKFTKVPIHVFPTSEQYSTVTAELSNILVCTGCRTVAVTEIVEAIKRRHPVVLLINEKLTNGTYDFAKDRVENAATYFLDNVVSRYKANYPNVPNLDIEYLEKNKNKINQFVKVYFVDDSPESIRSAALRASKAIEGVFGLRDSLPKEVIDKIFA